jgi:4-hydroxy 2-oxovalerate aldolase
MGFLEKEEDKMSKIEVLDCTLRDGGYVNQWNFGQEKIIRIFRGLTEAKINIIEYGYLSDKGNDANGSTIIKNVNQIKEILKEAITNQNIVVMANLGEYDVACLPQKENTVLYGIRLAFHKKDLDKAVLACHEIKSKGYQLFMQPMVSQSYSDEEFLKLIQIANDVFPYVFYIVDSFGAMKPKDLQRMLYLAEHNLHPAISIGFHSHNNLQLAYSNSKLFAEMQTSRKKVVDTSIFGMGRGAGNLNTELFAEYLNDNSEGNYAIKPLLKIMDSTLTPIYQEKYWGYSLAHYISAVYCCHPNYAAYLSEKNSLLMEDVEKIISSIEEVKKYSFDVHYIEELYFEYMTNKKAYKDDFRMLKDRFKGKKVLVIAPGKSAYLERDIISEFSKKEGIEMIAVNHEYPYVQDKEWIFVSNIRRFQVLEKKTYDRVIATSNIECENIFAHVRYQELINDVESVTDNAGLMCLKLLLYLGVKEIYLAGMDGYSTDSEANYLNNDLKLITPKSVTEKMNIGMVKVLEAYAKEIKISFLTQPKYLVVNGVEWERLK